MKTAPDIDDILAGNRRALSRAITLAESTRDDHKSLSRALTGQCRAAGRQALRIGLSGTPGVGKSSFVESFGMMLAEAGQRVAVLAVDPSSALSGGSILGDKTRMERLSRHPNAFIRPSPNNSQLGGVARNTRDAVLLCEAAGFDVVLIETVGVGQSETMVAQMCDLFVLLMAPAGGDELQGVKRGIMEMADMILVNKSDGDLLPAATRTCADYSGALRLLRRRPGDPEGFPKAVMVSALLETGLGDAWADMQALAGWRKEQGHWDARRAAQAQFWFKAELEQALLARLQSPAARESIAKLQDKVASGQTGPAEAAEIVLKSL